MAKKKSSADGFNMSAAIRELLESNKNMSSREVYEELLKRYPEQNINKNSCSVAFSHARRKLGIKGRRRRSVRMKKPEAVVRTKQKSSSSSGALDFSLLKMARKFIADAGSSEAALAAIQQVEALQIES